MNKFHFNFVSFAKWVGILCILFALIMIINVVAMEILGIVFKAKLLNISFQYILYGTIILGIGKIVELLQKR